MNFIVFDPCTVRSKIIHSLGYELLNVQKVIKKHLCLVFVSCNTKGLISATVLNRGYFNIVYRVSEVWLAVNTGGRRLL